MKTQGVGGAGTDSPISMTICQDNRCCKTGTIDSPGADHDQSQLNQYEENYLGGCKGFSLTKAPVVKLKIKGTDGWRGDWIKIFTGSKTSPNQGAYCNVDVWLDDNKEITLSCSMDKPGMSIKDNIYILTLLTYYIFFVFRYRNLEDSNENPRCGRGRH